MKRGNARAKLDAAARQRRRRARLREKGAGTYVVPLVVGASQIDALTDTGALREWDTIGDPKAVREAIRAAAQETWDAMTIGTVTRDG